MVTVGEGVVKRLGELFKAYVTSRSEETRYKVFELGKELFKEKKPHRVVGLYIETIKSLEERKGFETSGCEDLLLDDDVLQLQLPQRHRTQRAAAEGFGEPIQEAVRQCG